MREKLKPFGIEIKTHREISEISKAIARGLMEEPSAA